MKLKLLFVTLIACCLLMHSEVSAQTCNRSMALVTIDSDKRFPEPMTGDCTYDVVVRMSDSLGSSMQPFSYTFNYTGDGTVVEVIFNEMNFPGGTTFAITTSGGPLEVTFVVEASCSPLGNASAQIFGQNPDPLDNTPDVCDEVTTVLPVELSFFGAEMLKQETNVMLNWETSSELDNAGFEIQRSVDAKNWQALDFVKGSGTTTNLQHYKWYDETPLNLAYYRLKQIDFDGRYSHSPIIVVETETAEEKQLNAYPNPTQAELYWDTEVFELEDAQIHLRDQFGRLLKSCNADNGFLTLEDLPIGIYILSLQNQHQQFHQRIIKH